MAKKESTLADDLLNGKKLEQNFGRFVDPALMAKTIKQCHRYILDNSSMDHIQGLAEDSSPRQIANMLPNALPLHRKVFIEWQSNHYASLKNLDQILRQRNTPQDEIDRLMGRGPEFRTGILIERMGEGSWISIQVVEHGVTYPDWLWWPAAFYINTGDDPIPMRDPGCETALGAVLLPAMTFESSRRIKKLDRMKEKGGVAENGIFKGNEDNLKEMDGQVMDPIGQIDIWGYERPLYREMGGKGYAGQPQKERFATLAEDFKLARTTLGPLLNKAYLGLPAQLTYLGVDHYQTIQFAEKILLDLGGVVRWAVAAISAINTPVAVETYRPSPGRRMLGNSGSVKLLDSHHVNLVIPKRITKTTEYLRGEINKSGIRHRLHEVSAHYRHLSYKPSTPGWEEVEICGETFWRKRIDGHLRGDENLGVVEHTHTVVKGG